MATSPPIQNLHPHLASSVDTYHNIETSLHIITTMFGALNRFIAKLDAAPEEQQSGVHGAFGFQVLRNSNPEVPLDPWFDFIIGINGRTIVSLIIEGKVYVCEWLANEEQDNPDPNLFATEVRNCAGSNISLGIFCAKVRFLLHECNGSNPEKKNSCLLYGCHQSCEVLFSQHESDVVPLSECIHVV